MDTSRRAAPAWSPHARAGRARSGSRAFSRPSPPLPSLSSRSSFDVAMTDQDVPFSAEPPPELLDDRHRAMPAAGAADRRRDVQLAFLLEVRKRELQQVLDVPRHLEAVGTEHELRDLGIA